MADPFIIAGDSPVELDGSIDDSSELQVVYGGTSLASHSHSVEAAHEDLSSPSNTIRVKIADFAHGGDDWQITTSHQSGGTTVHWSRDTDHAYYDFPAMTDALETEVVATSNASPPATKRRTLWIKTKPVDAQPDRP